MNRIYKLGLAINSVRQMIRIGSNTGFLIVKLFWTIARGVYLWLQ